MSESKSESNSEFIPSYPDPDVQGLKEGYETCVTGDTRVHTLDGCYFIKDLVGKTVSIFNGTEWTKVKPFLAKEHDDFMKITFSDGSQLSVTYGSWASDLKIGMSVPTFRLMAPGCQQTVIEAYDHGKLCGQAGLCKSLFSIIECECQNLVRFCQNMMSANIDSICQFVAGWADACYQESHLVIEDRLFLFGHETMLQDLQILLRRININNARICDHCFVEKVMEISKEECQHIPFKVIQLPKYEHNNYFVPQVPQTIVRVELAPSGPSYCFSEPLKHKGVLANVLRHKSALCSSKELENRNYVSVISI